MVCSTIESRLMFTRCRFELDSFDRVIDCLQKQEITVEELNVSTVSRSQMLKEGKPNNGTRVEEKKKCKSR